ncbi:hypothetical protein AVEN_87675-1 [Araneus ventricosus]|uniref:Uncharacterized protein n=1 Tax=Araneus ventricosus TaxID=182803 RepID=A0A4Y2CXF1_ARAVE|nr:hypothetical protein AVEN_87675-1 [Araneus ventricosus]
MGFHFVPASTGGMGPELGHKTLESQFRFSLLIAIDAFFIVEVLWVQIVSIVNGAQAHGPDIALLIFEDHHQQQQLNVMRQGQLSLPWD